MTGRPLRGILLRAAALGVLLLLAPHPMRASTFGLRVYGVTAVVPASYPGSCPTRVEIGFVVDYPGPIGPHSGIDPASATAATITVDGKPADRYATRTTHIGPPPYYFVDLVLFNPKPGAHRLWLRGGVAGVRWRLDPSLHVFAYLATDWHGTAVVHTCLPIRSLRPKPTPSQPAHPASVRPSSIPTPKALSSVRSVGGAATPPPSEEAGQTSPTPAGGGSPAVSTRPGPDGLGGVASAAIGGLALAAAGCVAWLGWAIWVRRRR